MKRSIILFLAMITACQQSYGITDKLGGFLPHPMGFFLKWMFGSALTTDTEKSQEHNLYHSHPSGLSNESPYHEAQLNGFSSDDWTVLLYYIGFFDEDKKRALQTLNNIIFQQKGNRINALVNNEETVLHMACALHNTNVISFLLEHGARHDIYDKDGNLPIHLLIFDDRVSLDLLRTKFGDDIINLKDKNGKTLLDIIEKHIRDQSDAANLDDHDLEFLKERYPDPEIREEYRVKYVEKALVTANKLTEYATYLKSIGAKPSSEL